MARARAFLLCALAAVALSLAPAARASVSFTVVLDSLVRDSAAVVLETPVDARSVWEDGRIVSYTRVRVERVLAGAPPSDLWVRTLGGVVGDIGQQVEGEAVLRAGQRSVLFLARYQGDWVVTARGQGQFPVVADSMGALRLHKNQHAGVLLPPSAAVVTRVRAATTYALAARPAADVLDGRSVDDAATEIASAWRRAHAAP